VGGSWVGASAAQIARAVQRGDTTSTAVIADHVDHARIADRVLTVISVLRDAAALAEAEQVDEQSDLAHLALAGVPVVVEEPATERDQDVVHRLRGAGAVVLAYAGRGPAANPWRTDRTSGGASAAAVAAGVAPIASAVHPLLAAVCCGVVGLRPGHHPMAEPDGERGVLATTVEDAALGSAILAGRDPHAWPDPPERLRIAVVAGSGVLAPPPDPETRECLAAAARLLVAAGHDTVRVPAPRLTRLTIATLASWRPGHVPGAKSTMLRRGERVDWRDRCVQWLADNRFDLLLTPAMPGPARSSPATGYTEQWRLAGLPAIVVPIGVRRDRLPTAVQLVGLPDSQELLLAAAAQLEAAVQWSPHAPSWPRI
jgi:amidase